MKLASILLLLAPLLAQATPSDECSVNPAKLAATLKAAAPAVLTSVLPFEWNPASLAVSCRAGATDNYAAEAGCAITFAAKDGTAFYLRDASQDYNDSNDHGRLVEVPISSRTISLMTLGKSRPSDPEGNGVGPVVCTAYVYDFDVVNKRTGTVIQLKDFPFWPSLSYQQ
ncbi:MAG: hypothetical protein ACXVB9_12090 [Bdellovibrionota bacterium]